MPVTTRSMQRKRDEAGNIVAVRVAPAPQFVFHDLAKDLQLAEEIYGKNFKFNFSDWPKSFWLMPKSYVHFGDGIMGRQVEEFFQELKFLQMFPYAFRFTNPRKQIDVELEVVEYKHYAPNDFTIKKHGTKNVGLGLEISDVVRMEKWLVDHFTSCLESDFWMNGDELEGFHKITFKQTP
jgi:hypothetical protein